MTYYAKQVHAGKLVGSEVTLGIASEMRLGTDAFWEVEFELLVLTGAGVFACLTGRK